MLFGMRWRSPMGGGVGPHRGVGGSLLAGGLAWAWVVGALAWTDAVSVAARLAIAAAAAVVVVLVVGGRHVARLASRLRDAEARQAVSAHQATHDPLTGLANRTLLFERLELELRRLSRSGGAVLVAYLDVNNLKVVNDTGGHAAGDRLLCTVAERLSQAVRDVDTVARIGGDEFVVVCAVANAKAADRLIRRLGRAAAPPPEKKGDLSLSFGWTLTHNPEDDPMTLLARADMAMYRERGRGERGATSWLMLLAPG